MRINEVMTRELEPISPDDTLFEAASRMKARDVGALPVLDHDRLVGVITDRDITIRVVAEGHDPIITAVRDAMSTHPVCCDEEASVEEAARLMSERGVRRVFVVDAEQHPRGVVSIDDIAMRERNKTVAGDALAGVAEQQQPGAQPEHRRR